MKRNIILIGNSTFECVKVTGTKVVFRSWYGDKHIRTSVEIDALHALGGSVIEIPEWESGTRLMCYDGEEHLFVGPSPDLKKAVCCAPACRKYYEIAWCDIGLHPDVTKLQNGQEKNQRVADAAFPKGGEL